MDFLTKFALSGAAVLFAAWIVLAELGGDRPRKSLVKRHFAHSEEGFCGARPQRFNSGAFEYSRRQLELAGVTTLKEFSEIKHSIRTQEYRARLKALEAKRGESCVGSQNLAS